MAPVVTLAVLGAMAMQQASRQAPPYADAYHQQVKTAVDGIPDRIGDWVGTEMEVPAGALRLLQPNVISSREYRNSRSGDRIAFLLVHCRTARDMAGHYPPICYPSQGWTAGPVRQFNVQVDDSQQQGVTEYRFTRSSGQRYDVVSIANLLIMPDGTMTGDLGVVTDAAGDSRSHFMGAAQVQVVFSADIPAEQRELIFAEFLSAIKPVTDVIRSEGKHE